jgi:hypothetical protein
MQDPSYVIPPPMLPAMPLEEDINPSSAPPAESTHLYQPLANDSSRENNMIQVLSTASTTARLTDSMIREFSDQGYPQGLMNTFIEAKKTFPLRIWIVDNSGSMTFNDGSRIVEEKDRKIRVVRGCSRWSEMQQTVEYHARIAASIEAPTVFRMLNDPGANVGPQELTIAVNSLERHSIENDLQVALSTISKAMPGGVTPLTQHIWDIRATVQSVESHLRSTGTKIAIIIGKLTNILIRLLGTQYSL